MVHLPANPSRDLILDLLKEHDFTRTPSNQSLVVEKVHLAEIVVIHLLEPVVRDIVWVGIDITTFLETVRERFALTIEGVDLVSLVIIECFVREVLLGALDAELEVLNLRNYVICLDGIDEHILLELHVMEEVNENSVVIDEGSGNIRITKTSNRNRMVIHLHQRTLIDIEVKTLRVGIHLIFSTAVVPHTINF